MSRELWMPVLGIDADTHKIAYCLLDGKLGQAATIPRTVQGVRAFEYHERLKDLMGKAFHLGAEVCLEDIYFSRQFEHDQSVQIFKALAGVQGELVYEATNWGLQVRLIPAIEWQSSILGICRGREKIKKASARVARKHCRRPLTQDESDAFCIAVHGEYLRALDAACRMSTPQFVEPIYCGSGQ